MLVATGAPRLRACGISVPGGDRLNSGLLMYRLLGERDAAGAYGTYNAMRRRLSSFLVSLEQHARRSHGWTLALLLELGRATKGARLYLAGGASAVLMGWRERTVDVDIRLDGDEDRLLRAISALKDRLDINVELAGPLDFLPEPEGWRERSPSVGRFGGLEVFHTDFALQALSKIERGSPQDLDDVRAMLDRGLAGCVRDPAHV